MKTFGEVMGEEFNYMVNRKVKIQHKIDELLREEKISIMNIQKIIGYGHTKAARLFDNLIDENLIEDSLPYGSSIVNPKLKEKISKYLIDFLIKEDDKKREVKISADSMFVDNFKMENKWETVEQEFEERLNSGLKILSKQDYISTAALQRYFAIGYAKAAKLCDALIEKSFVCERNPKKQTLIDKHKLDGMLDFISNWLRERRPLFYNPEQSGCFNPRKLTKQLQGYYVYRCKGDIPHYSYADYIYDIIDYVTQGEHLEDYLNKIDEILLKKKKSLAEMDIKYYFRAIDRRERFCGGTIANEIKSGRFMKMFKRYNELTKFISNNDYRLII